jgi:hypothetical protein
VRVERDDGATGVVIDSDDEMPGKLPGFLQTAAERLRVAMDTVLTSGFLSAADEYSAMGAAWPAVSVPLQDAIEACPASGGWV